MTFVVTLLGERLSDAVLCATEIILILIEVVCVRAVLFNRPQICFQILKTNTAHSCVPLKKVKEDLLEQGFFKVHIQKHILICTVVW